MFFFDIVISQTFRGNFDQNGLRTHSFNPPLYARFIKINPRGWRSHISMRLELYGGAYSKCNGPDISIFIGGNNDTRTLSNRANRCIGIWTNNCLISQFHCKTTVLMRPFHQESLLFLSKRFLMNVTGVRKTSCWAGILCFMSSLSFSLCRQMRCPYWLGRPSCTWPTDNCFLILQLLLRAGERQAPSEARWAAWRGVVC